MKMTMLIHKINTFVMEVINRIQYPILEFVYSNKSICLYGRFDKYFKVTKSNNLGDDLNIDFIEYLSGKMVLKADYCLTVLRRRRVPIAAVGSILEQVCLKPVPSIVWGTGFKYAHNDINPELICRNTYRAVRGPKTRDIILSKGGICPPIYGDPILLISKFYPISVKKKYKYGLIPHKNEFSKVKSELLEFGSESKIINIFNYRSWHDVILEICSCEYILSSSLHGIIIADSYGIPNLWVRYTDFVDGDGFKYEDYFAGVRKKAMCIDMSQGISEKLILGYLALWIPPFIDSELERVCPFKIRNIHAKENIGN